MAEKTTDAEQNYDVRETSKNRPIPLEVDQDVRDAIMHLKIDLHMGKASDVVRFLYNEHATRSGKPVLEAGK